MRPPPKQTLSEWSDEYRYLSSESSAEPGRWRTARAPYLRGMMDAISDPDIPEVVIMKAAQIGYTEMLLNVIGYYVHYQPSPMMLMQPTLEMAEAFSKDRLAPMIRDTPVLTDRIKDVKSRDSGNTITHKKFNGGHLTLVGANSAASLASRPIRVLLCDEVDRYPVSAGTEGDPINLGRKRTKNFGNRKIILGGTPTIKGASRIEMAFIETDQRYYYVPCPHCSEMQRLQWTNVKFDEEGTNRERADSSFYMCVNSCVIQNHEKQWMLDHGEWRATKPQNSVVGFHISALYSPWTPWADIVYAFLVDKNKPDTLKTWINTELGETFEENGFTLEPGSLLERRGTHTDKTLPEETLLLTAGVDTQDDRVEVTVVAWGRDEESWVANHHVIRGDPGDLEEFWKKDVEEYLTAPRYTADGRRLLLEAVAIDSGGHHTQVVYNYVVKRKARRYFAIKGQAGQGKLGWPRQPSKTPKSRCKVFILGVDSLKSVLYNRLSKVHVPGPAYIHLHPDADESYCKQLTSEKCVTEILRGKPTLVWKPKVEGDPQEAQDCWCYAYAAFLGRGGPKLLEGLAARDTKPHTAREICGVRDSAKELPLPAEAPKAASVVPVHKVEQTSQSNPFLKRGWR